MPPNAPLWCLVLGIIVLLAGASWLVATCFKTLWQKTNEVGIAGWLRSLVSSLIRVTAVALISATRLWMSKHDLSDADEVHLTATFWLAVVGGSLWEIASAVSKARREKEVARSNFLSSMIFHFERSVNQKRTEAEKALERLGGPAQSIGQAREALDPDRHVTWILDSITTFYHTLATQADSSNQPLDFRVALFAAQNGKLIPRYSFSLKSMQRNCLFSPQKHPRRFELDNDVNPSCAVRCLQRETLVIVDDGRKKRHKGFFLDETQSQRLFSLIAYPIIKRKDGQIVYRAALVVDTQVPGFFHEQDRTNILTFLRQIEARLYLQDILGALLSPTAGVTNGPQKTRREKTGNSPSQETTSTPNTRGVDQGGRGTPSSDLRCGNDPESRRPRSGSGDVSPGDASASA